MLLQEAKMMDIMRSYYSTASEDEQAVFRDWLTGLLKTSDVRIVFTKSDGSERIMKCTLRESAIVKYEKKTERTKAKSNDTISVWDLEKASWRSFRFDSVQSITF
jgi:hypothetical protein